METSVPLTPTQIQQQDLARFKELFKQFTGCDCRLSADVADLDENCIYLRDSLAAGCGRAHTKRYGGKVPVQTHAGMPTDFPRGYSPPNRG